MRGPHHSCSPSTLSPLSPHIPNSAAKVPTRAPASLPLGLCIGPSRLLKSHLLPSAFPDPVPLEGGDFLEPRTFCPMSLGTAGSSTPMDNQHSLPLASGAPRSA